MPTREAKKDLILDYEQRFANELGLVIIPKPKVSFWMILIPMYFVFHIFGHKKYVEGRRVFSANFMISRRRVADETMEALRQNRPANLMRCLPRPNFPQKRPNAIIVSGSRFSWPTTGNF
ncbi:MAG: NF038143 family protein [Chloroflexota bacterium]